MEKKEYNFEMTLNRPVIEMFKESIFPFLEIEMMQGGKEYLANGQIKYSMNLDDDKAGIIKEIIYNVSFRSFRNIN